MAVTAHLLLSHLLVTAATAATHYSSRNAFGTYEYRHHVRGDQAALGRIRYLEEGTVTAVDTERGRDAVLPCRLLIVPRDYRVKWIKKGRSLKENIVLIANSRQQRGYGGFVGRARLRRKDRYDLSLVLGDVRLTDGGLYQCEVINGVEDQSITIQLQLRGLVFPYQRRLGRYSLNFLEAARVCVEQDAVLASYEQLYTAWTEGFDWCNAGWLEDGTVHYPVTKPRDPCGGRHLAPGIRSYGARDKYRERFDAFCFTSTNRGQVFFQRRPQRYDFADAKEACVRSGGRLAAVGQLYAAWRFSGLSRCDAGWLADASVRYPIRQSRSRCGGGVPGVRSVGFPPLGQREFGAYCYKLR
uniref:Hyaluronan and proteoglycan link protein 2-like protein n=1 Tax=Callorhinchus milii TaxID=7868 RepID=V9L0I4_CALMI